MSRSPTTKKVGMTTNTTRPAYGFSNSPAKDATTSAMNTTADAVAISAPAMASGWRASASRLVTELLLQALHVGDERIDVGGWQLAVLRRHWWLLGRLALRRHFRRVSDP